MEKQFSILLTFGAVILCATSVFNFETTQENLEKCPFKDTVNLTGNEVLENGSYIYQDVLVPADKLTNYNYSLKFQSKNVAVDLHLRGCVCGNPKYCVKLCCERGAFFNETSLECEPISEELNMPTDMNIVYENGSSETLNVFEHFIYQVGRPCKRLESLSDERDEWQLLEDGILHILTDDSRHDTLSYCLTPFERADGNVLMAMSCPVIYEKSASLEFNSYAMAISVIFFIPTVLIYLFVKELRSTMSGKLLICYLTALIMGYSILSFINISGVITDEVACTTLGFSGYYFFMAAFFWLNVLCFDIWLNFNEKNIKFGDRKNSKRFLYYTAYVWGMALVMLLLAFWAQKSDFVAENLKPGIDGEYCWLNAQVWSAAIFFYGPNLVIMIFNVITFLHLASKIYKVRRDVAKLTQKQKFIQENAVVIVRLFIIMGISWIMDIASYFLQNYPKWEFLFNLTDFCNVIQGVLIFILFVLKPSVIKAIRNSYSTTVYRKSTRSANSISTQFSKLSTSVTATP